MVNREIIFTRLDKLKEYLGYLESIKKYSKGEYLANYLLYGSSERFLHLAIECVIDIGNHIISDMNYRKPESNREIFQVLFENKLLDEKLTKSLSNMAGFRNILVHDYVKLNKEIVYEIIANDLKDIKKFIKVVSEYI